MRTSPDYLAAVSDLARDSESGSFPSFEIENCAADIAARYGVDDSDVRDDVAAAARRRIEAEELPVRFFFTDASGQKREVYVHDDDFFAVCIGGVQIGACCGTPQEAEKVIQQHLDDGVASDLITVEAYRQSASAEAPVESGPFYRKGSWATRRQVTA